MNESINYTSMNNMGNEEVSRLGNMWMVGGERVHEEVSDSMT